jgi:hypothetical protein
MILLQDHSWVLSSYHYKVLKIKRSVKNGKYMYMKQQIIINILIFCLTNIF